MDDDADCLRRYVEAGEQGAFAEVVRRHVAWVYAVVLRRTGRPELAEEATQMTFSAMARKAGRLWRHPALAAWLHRAAHGFAVDLQRRAARRSRYEAAAAAEPGLLGAAEPSIDWDRLRPVLDDALAGLRAIDRDLVVRRFFLQASFAELGRVAGLTENAARMRVNRALEALRARLAERGVSSTASALALALGSEAAAVASAPAGVVASAISAGSIGSSAGGASALVLFMSSTKLQVALAASVAAAALLGIRSERGALQREAAAVAALRAASADASALAADTARLQRERDQAALAASREREARRLAQETDALNREGDDLVRRRAAVARLAAGAPNKRVFDVGNVDVLPRPLSQSAPVYPPEFQALGVDGKAVVEMIVDANGQVQGAHAIQATAPEFGAVSEKAVAQWRFSAGMAKGAPVAVRLQVPVIFTLHPGTEPAAPSDWFPADK